MEVKYLSYAAHWHGNDLMESYQSASARKVVSAACLQVEERKQACRHCRFSSRYAGLPIGCGFRLLPLA